MKCCTPKTMSETATRIRPRVSLFSIVGLLIAAMIPRSSPVGVYRSFGVAGHRFMLARHDEQRCQSGGRLGYEAIAFSNRDRMKICKGRFFGLASSRWG